MNIILKRDIETNYYSFKKGEIVDCSWIKDNGDYVVGYGYLESISKEDATPMEVFFKEESCQQ